jgi:hypothetical protein
MPVDSDSPCVLASVANEIEAAGLVTALAAYDIEASVVGGFTSGMKAEAPGDVQVLVKESDLDRAKAALAEIRKDWNQLDWSTIDVGEPED